MLTVILSACSSCHCCICCRGLGNLSSRETLWDPRPSKSHWHLSLWYLDATLQVPRGIGPKAKPLVKQKPPPGMHTLLHQLIPHGPHERSRATGTHTTAAAPVPLPRPVGRPPKDAPVSVPLPAPVAHPCSAKGAFLPVPRFLRTALNCW